MNASGSSLKLSSAVVALAAALGGCATGKIWTYDEKTGADKGSKQHEAIVKGWGVPETTDLQDYVATVGRRLAAVSDCSKLDWTFSVLDSADARAFSTQGGYVYITRGMIEMLRSENDLAAVLAHEVAHVCTHDAQRQESIGQVAGIGNLALIASINPWALMSIFYIPEIAILPAGATMAGISRHDELNADRHGAEYLRRAGYPPESMSATMDVLTSMEAYGRDHRKKGGSYSRWMERVYADHPTAAKRQAKLGSIASIRASYDPEFLARLDGLEFGAAKREGLPSGGRRYFPQWDVTLSVPDDWVASMSKDDLWLYRKDGKARMHIERNGAGVTEDLCQALAPFNKGASPSGLQGASEGGVRSCTGLVGYRSRIRIGIVARDNVVGTRYVYHGFRGKFSGIDPVFLSIARSIEPWDLEQRPKPPVVRIYTVHEGESFATLAKTARLTSNPEETLRLLNQRYPGGELEPGQLVKVVE
jgi:predicted Zn-dependent protease